MEDDTTGPGVGSSRRHIGSLLHLLMLKSSTFPQNMLFPYKYQRW